MPRIVVNITKKRHALKQSDRPFGKIADGQGGEDDDVFHVQFDPASESVVIVVVRAVAAIENTGPEELRPLAEVIDPELLERIGDPDAGEFLRGGEITFSYAGFDITVVSDGDVWLERT